MILRAQEDKMEDQDQSGVWEESRDFQPHHGRKATKEQLQQEMEVEMVLPEGLVELPEDLEVSIILPSSPSEAV